MKNEFIPRSLAFLAGTATGLALGYYLHSEKGKALREQLGDYWEEALEDLGERAKEHLDDLIAALGAALEKGMNAAEILDDELRENSTGAIDDVRETIHDAEQSFEHGMDKARFNLQQKFNAAGL